MCVLHPPCLFVAWVFYGPFTLEYLVLPSSAFLPAAVRFAGTSDTIPLWLGSGGARRVVDCSQINRIELLLVWILEKDRKFSEMRERKRQENPQKRRVSKRQENHQKMWGRKRLENPQKMRVRKRQEILRK